MISLTTPPAPAFSLKGLTHSRKRKLLLWSSRCSRINGVKANPEDEEALNKFADDQEEVASMLGQYQKLHKHIR